jgi:hypothetical protein
MLVALNISRRDALGLLWGRNGYGIKSTAASVLLA